MQLHGEPSIGDRVARLRMRRKLTQEGLAERAGLSVDVVRKLEQGVRQTARLTTLNALARALDVEPSTLVGQPTTFEVRADDEQPSVLALRQAISPVADLLGQESDPEDPPTIAQLQASLRSTEHIRREGRMGEIGLLLPQLIRDAKAGSRTFTGSEGAAAQSVLAEAYQVAATTLAALGKEDAAFTALERSMEAARKGDDPHLETVGVSSLAWIFTKQGRLADAEQVALTTAERIEPGFRSQPMELALWGILLLRAATAAVRLERRDVVQELLSMASAAAARIGTDRLDYATPFGPTNMGVAKVNFLVEMEESADALRTARTVPDLHALPPTWRARFHVDRAIASADLNQDEAALRALLTAERTAPEWMRYHSTSRRLVSELRGRERRRTSPLTDLADRLGIDG
ncbi:helix-turn-helix domain-containing protein [Streptomyces lunaelactis]|uniref:helix-turn-helix domain-containing protein n=1 Tax=Streptomyces lunaelactis TaxID=1535768 RepID=UPI001584FF5A|nr:helix-turn-helix transcriptional regulator [Streptomyces lunaelactis]NUK05302.1 helix-turn-helix transcriptional regulator [Streptomyces lunaelactis]NUK17015.1 helix-turn-helix transcriptional regulator [Streptomyces lunaelactis]